ncbi:pyruvate kinase [Salinarimonas rosea]|uniref:pyruvate kinase n=1 Tax=Salinarimonas rosea TaxID=552063 RepID=UPI00042366A8|nr:pyruvate kinase [Salinarimonas rosea]
MRGDPETVALLAELQALRDEVSRESRLRWEAWRADVDRTRFAAGALNLAHYLALRRRDHRALQRGLMLRGLSSLGRLEGRVLATLDAAIVALAALAGEPTRRRAPSRRQFFRGETRLRAATDRLFGPSRPERQGRILVTLPSEAADDPALVAGLARAGADALRINCAHDGPDAWRAMIAHARAAEAGTGRRLRILMDIAGPKIRTGTVLVPDERARICIGDRLLLAKTLAPGFTQTFPFQATCTAPEVLDAVGADARVAVDDGRFSGRVVARAHDGLVVAIDQAKLGGARLKPEKGLNFPETALALDPLTDKDRADLDVVAELADLVGYSFVQTAEDIRRLQAELAARTPRWREIGLVAKVETPVAVRNLPEIMVAAAGHQPFAVMIARGDLAVEIGFARLAEMQEELLWLAEAAHVPVIWATQVLERLVKSGLPSRGEMTDAAMAARAECVMLNKGPNVEAAVEALDGLFRRMGEHQSKKTPTLRALRTW